MDLLTVRSNLISFARHEMTKVVMMDGRFDPEKLLPSKLFVRDMKRSHIKWDRFMPSKGHWGKNPRSRLAP